MKKALVLGFAVALIVFCIGPAQAQYKATMRLASALPMDHPYMVGAQKFADLIKERTNGRIEIKLYPSNQLGKGEREMTEGIQQGAIDLLVTSTGPLGGFSPSINILDFPFLFRDFNHVDLVMDGPIGRKLLDDFEKVNIKALSFWENGFRHLTNSKLEVKKVADAKGLKIRTMENKVHLSAWKDAGLNPTPMAWGEVYTALQQKVIDGQENPIAVFYSSKFWDAGQKYFSLTAHVYSPSPFLMSKKTYDSMPKEDQELFVKTSYETGKFQRKINRDAEEAKLKEMAAKGVAIVRDVDRESFKKAMAPTYEAFSSQFPKADIEAIMNAK
ncbi:MAG: C4-dicarboxylate ABC transporter substrate-binding protein [Desulfobacterales bacterium CG07_land_8_20_14_0_80_52_14]|nr:MAG: C4-dicarboxylate ABC transporter substrate-binding protein [Desulfobacterales bacterium CG23_combo_of_CG06-09_8_20_14_all_52_9]PIU49975.1 MAG: C4-dicarboxylate ABC transporter substrate-binding protein [Desulfobacterales bacterium CG07_land_8_20_14_0_80_52_14]